MPKLDDRSYLPMGTAMVCVPPALLAQIRDSPTWTRCPAVTPGGRPYFYIYREEIDGVRCQWSCSWDRRVGEWAIVRDR